MTKQLKRTPTNQFFTDEVAEKLDKLYAIRTMEQLVSIAAQGTGRLRGAAKLVGMDEKDFNIIIQKASKVIRVPKHSGRKYPLGAMPQKNK